MTDNTTLRILRVSAILALLAIVVLLLGGCLTAGVIEERTRIVVGTGQIDLTIATPWGTQNATVKLEGSDGRPGIFVAAGRDADAAEIVAAIQSALDDHGIALDVSNATVGELPEGDVAE